MKSFKQFEETLDEKFNLPRPPKPGAPITGFQGKFKINQAAMSDDNTSAPVIKDVKAALKIVEKHFRKLGLQYKEEEVLIGPFDVAKDERLKVGSGDLDFALDIYPGHSGKNPKLPRDKEIDFSDMIKELGKLKSFGNFPRTDISINWDY